MPTSNLRPLGAVMTQAFFDFLTAVHKNKPRPNGLFSGRLLSLDPGETTGWALWSAGYHPDTSIVVGYSLEACGQLETWDKEKHSILPCVQNFPQLLQSLRNKGVHPTQVHAEVVIESYRVYEWKTDSHAWSDVPTLRIIGSMETRIIDRDFPYTMQTAQQAKNFVKDDLLKAWGLYDRGQRHSRDAMRHGLFYLLFGK